MAKVLLGKKALAAGRSGKIATPSHSAANCCGNLMLVMGSRFPSSRPAGYTQPAKPKRLTGRETGCSPNSRLRQPWLPKSQLCIDRSKKPRPGSPVAKTRPATKPANPECAKHAWAEQVWARGHRSTQPPSRRRVFGLIFGPQYTSLATGWESFRWEKAWARKAWAPKSWGPKSWAPKSLGWELSGLEAESQAVGLRWPTRLFRFCEWADSIDSSEFV